MVPHLRLRDAHVLSQTCNALRQTFARASPVLEALALVRSWPLASVSSRLLLTVCYVQDLMPRQHLASQAPPGSCAAEQLQALAALHARIRRGQAAVVSELHVTDADLPEPDLTLHSFTQSPGANCAALVWGRGYVQEDCTPATMGTVVVGQSPDGSMRSDPQPSNVSFSECCAGFSADGRYCTTVSCTGKYSHEQEAYVLAADGEPRAVVCTFDTQKERRWLLQAPHADFIYLQDSEIVCSDSRSSPCAALDCTDDRDQEALLVFQVLKPCARLLRTHSLKSFLWLPGTQSLVLLTWDCQLCSGNLSKMDVLPWETEPSPVVSRPLSSLFQAGAAPSMAASPSGRAVWVAQQQSQHTTQQEGDDIRLTVHASTTLVCIGTWHLSVGGQPQAICLHATCQALAISHTGAGRSKTSVYALSGDTIGSLLFRLDDYPCLSFSADGLWLVHVAAGAIRVLNARTGSCVLHLPPAELSRLPNMHVCATAVSWNVCDPRQLLVTCTDSCWGGGMLFSTMQF